MKIRGSVDNILGSNFFIEKETINAQEEFDNILSEICGRIESTDYSGPITIHFEAVDILCERLELLKNKTILDKMKVISKERKLWLELWVKMKKDSELLLNDYSNNNLIINIVGGSLDKVVMNNVNVQCIMLRDCKFTSMQSDNSTRVVVAYFNKTSE